MDKFFMIAAPSGICLCDKDGVFLILKNGEDVVKLKELLEQITVIMPDFQEEAEIVEVVVDD